MSSNKNKKARAMTSNQAMENGYGETPRVENRRRIWRYAIGTGACVALIAIAGWMLHSRSAAVGNASAQVPDVDKTGMEPEVAARLNDARQFVMNDPRNAYAWGRYGEVCDAHGLLAEAEICYSQAMQLDPQAFRWTYLLAWVRELHSGEGVIELYERAAALNPDFAPVHARLGNALVERGRRRLAEQCLRRAIEVDPTLGVAHLRLGQLLIMHGNIDEAMTVLQRAEQLLQRDRGAVLASLAQAHAMRGEDDLAAAMSAESRRVGMTQTHFDDAVRNEVMRHAVSSTVASVRAAKFTARGDHALAVKELRSVCEKRPHEPLAHYDLGLACQKSGLSTEALAAFQRASKLDPTAVSPHMRIGHLMMAAGRHEEAAERFRQVLRIDEDRAAARALLAEALGRLDRFDEADAQFRRAAAALADNADVRLLWGKLLVRHGRLKDALPLLDEAVRLAPENALIRVQRNTIVQQLGRMESLAQH